MKKQTRQRNQTEPKPKLRKKAAAAAAAIATKQRTELKRNIPPILIIYPFQREFTFLYIHIHIHEQCIKIMYGRFIQYGYLVCFISISREWKSAAAMYACMCVFCWRLYMGVIAECSITSLPHCAPYACCSLSSTKKKETHNQNIH